MPPAPSLKSALLGLSGLGLEARLHCPGRRPVAPHLAGAAAPFAGAGSEAPVGGRPAAVTQGEGHADTRSYRTTADAVHGRA